MGSVHVLSDTYYSNISNPADGSNAETALDILNNGGNVLTTVNISDNVNTTGIEAIKRATSGTIVEQFELSMTSKVANKLGASYTAKITSLGSDYLKVAIPLSDDVINDISDGTVTVMQYDSRVSRLSELTDLSDDEKAAHNTYIPSSTGYYLGTDYVYMYINSMGTFALVVDDKVDENNNSNNTPAPTNSNNNDEQEDDSSEENDSSANGNYVPDNSDSAEDDEDTTEDTEGGDDNDAVDDTIGESDTEDGEEINVIDDLIGESDTEDGEEYHVSDTTRALITNIFGDSAERVITFIEDFVGPMTEGDWNVFSGCWVHWLMLLLVISSFMGCIYNNATGRLFSIIRYGSVVFTAIALIVLFQFRSCFWDLILLIVGEIVNLIDYPIRFKVMKDEED